MTHPTLRFARSSYRLLGATAFVLGLVGCGGPPPPSAAPPPAASVEAAPETADVSVDPPSEKEARGIARLSLLTRGSRVPGFRLTLAGGEAFDTASLVRKQAHVVVFFTTWCPVCERKMPIIRRALEKAGGDIPSIGVVLDEEDTRGDVAPYIKRHRLPFKTLHGEQNGALVGALDPKGSFPIVYVVGRGGSVVDVQLGLQPEHEARLEQALRRARDDDDAGTQPRRPERVAGPISDAARAAVEAQDRAAEDREKDARRHPAELLTFLGVQPGMRVADLGAGDGYTTELLVRMVGAKGKVYSQNNKYIVDKFVSKTWPERLKLKVNSKVVRIDSELEDPLPAKTKATGLDLVTMIFYYHDAVAQQADRSKMNQAIRKALKPGGAFVVVDHHAKPGSGLAAGKELHRLDESIVKKEVQAAGFQLAAEAQFYRDPSDPLDDKSFSRKFVTDRYALKFVKPNAK